VTAVTFLAGLFIYARAGSRKFYWSAVLDGRTVDALDFASAESSPSYLVDVLAIGDVLYLGCKDKIEAWYPTGDGTLPFQRITQRTTSRGVVATSCMAELDNALHFVGDDRSVYRMSEVPERISNHGIDEQLAKIRDTPSSTCGWTRKRSAMTRQRRSGTSARRGASEIGLFSARRRRPTERRCSARRPDQSC
jgi:hypothetical protein